MTGWGVGPRDRGSRGTGGRTTRRRDAPTSWSRSPTISLWKRCPTLGDGREGASFGGKAQGRRYIMVDGKLARVCYLVHYGQVTLYSLQRQLMASAHDIFSIVGAFPSLPRTSSPSHADSHGSCCFSGFSVFKFNLSNGVRRPPSISPSPSPSPLLANMDTAVVQKMEWLPENPEHVKAKMLLAANPHAAPSATQAVSRPLVYAGAEHPGWRIPIGGFLPCRFPIDC